MFKSGALIGLLLLTATLVCFRQTDSWLGNWTGEHKEGVTYTIRVKNKYKGMNQCEVHAEGIQTFYTLECWATGNPTTLSVYYRSTKDGAFYAGDRVKLNQPLFTLKRGKSNVTWQWQQIFDDASMVMRRK